MSFCDGSKLLPPEYAKHVLKRLRSTGMRNLARGVSSILYAGAGEGAMLEPFVEYGYIAEDAVVVMVEKNPERCKILRQKFPKFNVIEGDFLEYNADESWHDLDQEPFELVLMHPTYDGRVYIDFLMHCVHSRFYHYDHSYMALILDGDIFEETDREARLFKHFVDTTSPFLYDYFASVQNSCNNSQNESLCSRNMNLIIF